MSGLSQLALGALVVAVLGAVPMWADGYQLSLGISLLNYAVLATAWALFSGPTRYVSLATSAFFGIGAYTVAVLGEVLPWPLVLATAAVIGVVVALLVGLSTLRFSGVYFVIFTFGLAELIRQVVIWYEVNFTRVLGRYVFVPITQEQIYWQLLALVAIVLTVGWFIQRSRLGFALRIIGDDETVAAHTGINMTAAKLTLFAVSALFITVTGAVLAPRWTYIEPSIAFNQIMAFQVLIMALLGGAERLYGPLLGVIPLTLLFEYLIGKFPNSYSILLGLSFMLIVYGVPNGIAGLIESAWRRGKAADGNGGLVRRLAALVRRPAA